MIQNLVTSKMLQIAMSNEVKKAHAVGEVIMLANETDPAQAFGGTWERTAKGRFPLGSDVENAGGGQYPLKTNGENTTGGEATHTLTIAEMPEHNHSSLIWANAAPMSIDSESNGAGFKIQAAWSDTLGVNNFSNGITGGSQPYNNMPPYVVFNFWKKISD